MVCMHVLCKFASVYVSLCHVMGAAAPGCLFRGYLENGFLCFIFENHCQSMFSNRHTGVSKNYHLSSDARYHLWMRLERIFPEWSILSRLSRGCRSLHAARLRAAMLTGTAFCEGLAGCEIPDPGPRASHYDEGLGFM